MSGGRNWKKVLRESGQESPSNAGALFADRGNHYLAGEGGELLGEIRRGLRGLGDVAGEIEEERGDGIEAERVGPEGLSEGMGNGAEEIAFKLIAHVLEKAHVEPALLEQVRLIGKKQIQSMSVFLKVYFVPNYASLCSHFICYACVN